MSLSRGEARDLLSSHGLRPRRQLGQNFVVDPNTLRRIVRLAKVAAGDRVLEIGAGLGALTEAEIFALVKAAFGQRRKMLRRSLATMVTPEAFAAADVEPTRRPEELDVMAFGRLAAAVR